MPHNIRMRGLAQLPSPRLPLLSRRFPVGLGAPCLVGALGSLHTLPHRAWAALRWFGGLRHRCGIGQTLVGLLLNGRSQSCIDGEGLALSVRAGQGVGLSQCGSLEGRNGCGPQLVVGQWCRQPRPPATCGGSWVVWSGHFSRRVVLFCVPSVPSVPSPAIQGLI